MTPSKRLLAYLFFFEILYQATRSDVAWLATSVLGILLLYHIALNLLQGVFHVTRSASLDPGAGANRDYPGS